MAGKVAVGFVGVGLMGHGMAANLLANGHPLTVCAHANRKPVDDLLAKGATEAADLAALALAAEVVILCVSNSDTVDEVLFAARGLLAGAQRGTVFIDASTSAPERTRGVNARLREDGMLFCDAPLSRSPARAEDGALVSLVSCEVALFERVEPLLRCYSEVAIHIGEEVGMAHEVKLINNFIALSYICTWAEGYNTCLAKGIDPKGLHAVVSAAGMNCVNFQNYSKFVLEGDQNGHKFSVRNCDKDIGYYLDLAAQAGVGTRMAAPVAELFGKAVKLGYADDYGPVMPKVLGELDGTVAKDLPRGQPD